MLRLLLRSYRTTVAVGVLCGVPASASIGAACGCYAGIHESMQTSKQTSKQTSEQTLLKYCANASKITQTTVTGALGASIVCLITSVVSPLCVPLYVANLLNDKLKNANNANNANNPESKAQAPGVGHNKTPGSLNENEVIQVHFVLPDGPELLLNRCDEDKPDDSAC